MHACLQVGIQKGLQHKELPAGNIIEPQCIPHTTILKGLVLALKFY